MAVASIVEIIGEEIALEGLDGITLPSLWLRLEDRDVGETWKNDRAKSLLWTSIAGNSDFTFYHLPQPRPDIVKFDRYSKFEAESRIYNHPEGEVLDIYEWEGVNEGGVIGSCPTFKTRTDITSDIRDEEGNRLCSYTEVLDRWGRSLVVVASQSVRNISLTGIADVSDVIGDNPLRYYLLELIGRSRRNGLTTGSVLPHFSCQPLNMNPKLLYYVIKIMVQQKFVLKQSLRTRYKDKSVSINLLHLTRFYRPLPDRGKEVTSLICQYLSEQENKQELVSVIKEKFSLKRKFMYKSVLKRAEDCLYVKMVPYREIYPSATSREYLCKDKNSEKQLSLLVLAKEYKEEEERVSEEEKEDEGEEYEEVQGGKIGGICGKATTQEDVVDRVYQVVYNGGVVGMRSNQIMTELKFNYRLVRNAITCLLRYKKVHAILKSLGSCRVSFYIAKPFVEASSESFGKAMTEFQQKTTQLDTESALRDHASDSMDTDTAIASGSGDRNGTNMEIEYIHLNPEQNQEETAEARTTSEAQLNAEQVNQEEQTGSSDKGSEEASENRDKDDGLQSVTGENGAEAQASTTVEAMDVSENSGNVAEEVQASGTDGATGVDGRFADIKCTILENILPEDLKTKTMACPISTDRLTERMLKIANCLLDGLKLCRLYEYLAAARRAIVKKMREQGETIRPPSFPFASSSQKKKKKKPEVDEESICLKTVLRVVDWCQREGKLKTLTIRLEYKDRVTNTLLICATDVEKDDTLVLRAIHHQKLRIVGFAPSKTKRLTVPMNMMDWVQLVSCALRAVTPFNPRGHQRKMTTKWKKWEKAWWLHRFMWYVVHGYQGVGPSQLVEPTSNQDNENVEENEEAKEPHVYLDTDDWRRYIPPVRRHSEEGVPEGVCTVGDLLMVIPVCIFAPIVNTQEIPIVKEFLSDSRKRLYPLMALPLPVLGSMLQERIYTSPFLDGLRNLSALGLVAVGQLIATSNRTKQPVYVRKTAMLLDTRDSLPGNLFTVLPEGLTEFPTLTFEFNSLESVQQYWASLQTVAFNTDLNNTGMTDRVEEIEEIHPMKDCLAYRPFSQIVQDYCLPGNRRGAAGLDCGLFIHMRRNWSRQDKMNHDPAQLRRREQRAIAKTQRTAPVPAGEEGTEPRPSVSRKSPVKSPSASRAGKEGAPRRRHLKKAWTVHRDGFYPLPARYRTGRIGIRRKKEGREKLTGEDRYLYDDTDRQARQGMQGRRCRFTAKEISIMLLGKVALSYLAGESFNQSFYIPIRDVLHQRIQTSKDKTTMAIASCIRRYMKRTSIRHSMSHYLMQLMNNKELVSQYGSKLKRKNLKEPCTAESAAIIRDLINDLIETYVSFETVQPEPPQGTLPISLGWMWGRYKVMLSEDAGEEMEWKNVTSGTECCSTALRNFHLSHLLSVEDKQTRDYEMYMTLKQYPDKVVFDTCTYLVQKRLLTKNKKFADGTYASGIARYMINFRHQVKLHQSRFPIKMFLGSAQVLSALRSPPEGHGEGGAQQSAQSAAPYFLPLSQGMASASHVAFVIGMTAQHKLNLQLETSAELIDINSSQHASFLPEDANRGMKRGHEQTMEESEGEEEGGPSQDGGADRFRGVGGRGRDGRRVSGSPAKKQKKNKGDGNLLPIFHSTPREKSVPLQSPKSKRSVPSALGIQSRGCKRTLSLTSPIEGKRRKRMLSLTSAGGQDQPTLLSDSSSEDESSAAPAPRPGHRIFWRPESNKSKLFVTHVQPEHEGRVKEVGEGVMQLDSRDVSVKFSKADRDLPTPLQARMLRYRASFTLLALRRSKPSCILDPRKYSSSYRLSLSLSHLALALKEGELNQQQSSALPGTGESSSSSVGDVPSSSAGALPEIVKEASPVTFSPAQSIDTADSTSPTQPGEAAESSTLPIWLQPNESGSSSAFVEQGVMKKIVKEQTQTLPFEIDWDQWWEECTRDLDVMRYTACQKVNRCIFNAGLLGATWNKLKEIAELPEQLLHDSLQYLVSHKATSRGLAPTENKGR